MQYAYDIQPEVMAPGQMQSASSPKSPSSRMDPSHQYVTPMHLLANSMTAMPQWDGLDRFGSTVMEPYAGSAAPSRKAQVPMQPYSGSAIPMTYSRSAAPMQPYAGSVPPTDPYGNQYVQNHYPSYAGSPVPMIPQQQTAFYPDPGSAPPMPRGFIPKGYL